MKFKIKHKLLVLITLPTIALIIFSLNHFNDKYAELQMHSNLLVYSKIIKNSSNLIHELQIERGLSSSYINNHKDKYFILLLETHLKKTLKATEAFENYMHKMNQNILSVSNQNYLQNIHQYLIDLKTIRKKIITKNINSKDSFNFYTKLINALLGLSQSFETHSNDNETYNDTLVLQKLLLLQEFAGQERAFVSYMLNSDEITIKDMKKQSSLVIKQAQYYQIINQLLHHSKLKSILKKIDTKYKHSYFYEARQEIVNYEKRKYLTFKIFKIIGFGGMIHDLMKYKKSSNIKFYNAFLQKKEKFDLLVQEYMKASPNHTQKIQKLQKSFEKIAKNKNHKFDEIKIFHLYKTLEHNTLNIDPKKWFDVTTQRINELHKFEKNIIYNIDRATQKDLNALNNSLITQLSLTLGTIVLLLLGAIFIAKNITNSILNLKKGVDDFFNFLNFKTSSAKHIVINSNDEIHDIAQNINSEILSLEKNLKEDKDFINEATHIVTLMKDGDFSEKLYFEPNNPNLKDLKNVLDQLIALITAKIKEQTQSLEKLNSSLEDKVFKQTVELHNQVKELTIARDKAIQAEVAKDEFLANMSHEIRTPMNSVIGFSNLLEKLITDPIQKDYLSSIKRGGSALLDIINDILDLSKIEAGKLEIILESVNIKQLVLEMESIFSIKLMQKNLNFEVAIDDSIPKYLLLDSARIRQILFNIIGNAIKFTDSGVIKLSVKKIFDDEKKSKIDLALIVEDTGIGIDAKNLKSIFNSFEQQKGQNQKYGGTGLGLTICKKLLNFMNGDIEVQSKLKEGSKFTVYLKDISVSLIENEKKQPQFIAESIEFNSATILVVDDIKDNRKLIKSALKNYGLKIYEAQNGKDALEKLKSIKVDLICMDIKMPIMDGYEAISIIKKNSLLKDIPVVAITASVMGKDMQKIKEYKFDGYLRKPISYDELILELTKFLTYNTYELKQKKDASIEENTYVDLPKTVKILQEVYIKKWTKIKDMGDFSLILEFATNLIDLANLHPNNLLLTYAKELKLNCESFDIERIDFMMNSFPNLIAKLENILQKDKA